MDVGRLLRHTASELARLLTQLGHYTSTYCLHATNPTEHRACRNFCKTCGARCRCHCHAQVLIEPPHTPPPAPL